MANNLFDFGMIGLGVMGRNLLLNMADHGAIATASFLDCGLPSTVGIGDLVIPEVVVDGETGLLVPPRDHHALAHAIARLLKDQKLREQMGGAGFERVQRVFSAARMVEQTLEVYRAYGGVHEGARDRGLSADSPRPPARD
jgi:glycosyltransferase involved in cell wall biosynthesis